MPYLINHTKSKPNQNAYQKMLCENFALDKFGILILLWLKIDFARFDLLDFGC